VGQVGVAILNDEPSSQLLHLQTVQRSLRTYFLRALLAEKMRGFGSSASHVAKFCGGKTDEQAPSVSPRTVLALKI
jgi:hypothetical protein